MCESVFPSMFPYAGFPLFFEYPFGYSFTLLTLDPVSQGHRSQRSWCLDAILNLLYIDRTITVNIASLLTLVPTITVNVSQLILLKPVIAYCGSVTQIQSTCRQKHQCSTLSLHLHKWSDKLQPRYYPTSSETSIPLIHSLSIIIVLVSPKTKHAFCRRSFWGSSPPISSVTNFCFTQ